jgi:hypothetical protein
VFVSREQGHQDDSDETEEDVTLPKPVFTEACLHQNGRRCGLKRESRIDECSDQRDDG